MIIKPPNDYGIPEPKFLETVNFTYENHRRTQIYLNVKPWKCPECGTMVFGRCLGCPYCRHKLHKDTPRPTHYTKEGGV